MLYRQRGPEAYLVVIVVVCGGGEEEMGGEEEVEGKEGEPGMDWWWLHSR